MGLVWPNVTITLGLGPMNYHVLQLVLLCFRVRLGWISAQFSVAFIHQLNYRVI